MFHFIRQTYVYMYIRVVDNIYAKIHSNDDPKDNLLSFELEKQSFLQKLIIKHCFVAENVLRPKSFSLFYSDRYFWIVFQQNVHDNSCIIVAYDFIPKVIRKVYVYEQD